MSADRWSDEFLDAMRQVMDPPADEVIGQVVDAGDTQAVNRLLRALVENDDLVPEDMPQPVRDYLERSSILPAWADPQLIDRGQQAFLMHAPEAVLLLFYAALPSAYASRKGAQVLRMTRRLIGRYAWRRIIETAQFLMDALAPGGLGPQGRGVRAAQKVRLTHAAIRHYILHVPKWRDQWNLDWGMPINQEDLAGTLMTFSSLIVERMPKFGVRLHADEEAAYLHTWKVIGHILGIRPDLLPADAADARALMETIFRRQWQASEAGTELSGTLLAMMEERTPRPIRGLPHTALRYFAGGRAADLLGVKPYDWTVLLLQAQRGVFALADRINHESLGIGRLARSLNLLLLNGILDAERDRHRPPFRIPAELRATGMRPRKRRPRKSAPSV